MAPAPSIDLLLRPRPRDLGGFSVKRILPSAERRMVGPFIFLDEMGPAVFAPGQGLDVRPHPHIGLATVTYLFEGAIHHRDSLGIDQIIRPGDVNWMTAGRGIVHSERSPAAERKAGQRLHGIQSWVALPEETETTQPDFVHHPQDSLPRIVREGVRLRLIAGTAFGETSPVEVLSELFYLHAELDAGAELTLPREPPERAAYVVHGSIEVDGTRIEAGTLVAFRYGAEARLRAAAASCVMLLGGRPVGPREIEWNFVASSPALIEQAKADWQAGRFPKVPGDETEFIPLPGG
ncbi:MAG: pirin family protein [Alphaproteobacteria bacterium]|nr:pirin family protein [Alphaproteobacteria bacterium]